MEERIIKNGKVKILPGNELPYVGQVVEFENEYYSIIRLSKIEWVDTAIRVNFVMERVEENSVMVTDKELKKAKKAKFTVL